jgi:hypothetical protein
VTTPVDPTRFDEAYRDDRRAHGLPAATPWDIGGAVSGNSGVHPAEAARKWLKDNGFDKPMLQ